MSDPTNTRGVPGPEEEADPASGGAPERPDDQSEHGDAPTGGSTTTEEQLTADNEAEEDTLRAIDGDSPSE